MAARQMDRLDSWLEEWLHNADDEVLECRGQGHEFDHIHRRKRTPLRNTRVGSSQITWTCPHCGTERTRTIEPDGTLFPPVYYSYKYPRNYKGPAGVTRRMCFDETERRIADDAAKTVPPVEFRGAEVKEGAS
jgi:hypothetical protein